MPSGREYFYSEEAQAILGRAPISIATINPPPDHAARYDGLLDTGCVSNGDAVHAGEVIALFTTAARYGDVATLERSLRGAYAPSE